METDFIKQTIRDVLEKFNVEFELEVVLDGDINATRFLIRTNDPNLLIGYKGATLFALSHIIKRIVDKRFDRKENRLYFILDINDYQGKRIEEIKTSAHMLAERARYFKSSVEMNPLPPYERMIVHSLFASSKDFETHSLGEGEERRVVIRFKGEE